MRRALEYCKISAGGAGPRGDPGADPGGVMNEGFVSMQLGLRGMPAVAEDIMISRDIMLSELTAERSTS